MSAFQTTEPGDMTGSRLKETPDLVCPTCGTGCMVEVDPVISRLYLLVCWRCSNEFKAQVDHPAWSTWL